MFADLAVLSADYFSVPEDQIQKIESVLTVMNGKVVHAKGAFRRFAPPPLPVDPAWSPVAALPQDEGRYLAASMRGGHRCGHCHTSGDSCGGTAHAHNWIQGDAGVWSLSCSCMVV